MIPSFTFNILTINGRRDELEAFRQYACGFDPSVQADIPKFNPLCFNNFIELTDKECSNMVSLEEARRAKWGTTSNAAGVTLKEKGHELRYSFTTASTIPRAILLFMIDKFPNLKFDLEYRNDRKGIEGSMKIFRGKAVFAQTDKFARERKHG
jgi:hypothetical protein